MSITYNRKKKFSDDVLSSVDTSIGFIDVGSGGNLKYPWDLIPTEKIQKFDFEPTGKDTSNLLLCISDRVGKSKFYIAKDERSSSLHEASTAFMERYNDDSLKNVKVIEVQLNTLDKIFLNRTLSIDLMDVNVEGHDYFVLKGAGNLFSNFNIKLLKIEFELTEVWKGQGWFGDIDHFMRERKYELANIEIETRRPASVSKIFCKGEPLWGKAYYVPSIQNWDSFIDEINETHLFEEIWKAAFLYTIADLPGRAVDLLKHYGRKSPEQKGNVEKLIKKIFWTYEYNKVDFAFNKVNKIKRFFIKK